MRQRDEIFDVDNLAALLRLLATKKCSAIRLLPPRDAGVRTRQSSLARPSHHRHWTSPDNVRTVRWAGGPPFPREERCRVFLSSKNYLLGGAEIAAVEEEQVAVLGEDRDTFRGISD